MCCTVTLVRFSAPNWSLSVNKFHVTNCKQGFVVSEMDTRLIHFTLVMCKHGLFSIDYTFNSSIYREIWRTSVKPNVMH